jgi:nicotinate-nucleotide pyrophosphorylase (carboxylating)
LDKNYIEAFGNIDRSLRAVAHLNGYLKVIQLKGKHKDIGAEAREAAGLGADILFIDTGDINDVGKVIENIKEMNLRDRIQIAFSGGVQLEQMDRIKALDVDIVDIGAAIMDAPLLDLKYEVRSVQ